MLLGWLCGIALFCVQWLHTNYPGHLILLKNLEMRSDRRGWLQHNMGCSPGANDVGSTWAGEFHFLTELFKLWSKEIHTSLA